jgi:uncharacterized protein (UPF0333 family)
MLIPHKYHPPVVAAVLLIISLAIISYSASRFSETGFLRKMVLEAAAPVEDAVNISLKGCTTLGNGMSFSSAWRMRTDGFGMGMPS